MSEMFSTTRTKSIRPNSMNVLSRIIQFFSFRSKNKKKLSLESKILNKSELTSLLDIVPEDVYEVNTNKTIYSSKLNGKAFFVDQSQFNFDVYLHQTNVENGVHFCDKYRDLMYVLRVLFSQETNYLMDRKELKCVLQVVPKDLLEVNSNQTIYSFKLNGKAFFIDKDWCSTGINGSNDNLDEPDFDSRYVVTNDIQVIQIPELCVVQSEGSSQQQSFDRFASKGNSKLRPTRLFDCNGNKWHKVVNIMVPMVSSQYIYNQKGVSNMTDKCNKQLTLTNAYQTFRSQESALRT